MGEWASDGIEALPWHTESKGKRLFFACKPTMLHTGARICQGNVYRAQVELGLTLSLAIVVTVRARLGVGLLAGMRMVFVQAPRRRAAPIGGRVLAEKQTVAVFSPSPPPGNTRRPRPPHRRGLETNEYPRRIAAAAGGCG